MDALEKYLGKCALIEKLAEAVRPTKSATTGDKKLPIPSLKSRTWPTNIGSILGRVSGAISKFPLKARIHGRHTGMDKTTFLSLGLRKQLAKKWGPLSNINLGGGVSFPVTGRFKKDIKPYYSASLKGNF
jgi:hypothetical protein